MKITAYPLYGHAATLQRSPGGKGWDFLCPCAFEATWHGGPCAEDVEIRLAEDPPGQSGFVQSHGGEGRITFYPGYQCKTEEEYGLWVRGPVNVPREGLMPLESILDTSAVPGTLVIDWKFTRPGQTVRFEAGEPFCTILPYPKAGLDEVTVDVVPLAGDLESYEEALQRMAEDPAVRSVFTRLAAGLGAPAAPVTSGWEKIPFPPPFEVIPPPPPLPAEQAARLFRGDRAMRISVILPATNESVLLRRTVEQFAATLPPDSEVIVVDNGSTDGCADFLAEESRDNVHLIRSTQPLGVAAARNRGLAEARGEIVVFSDAHIDVPERWWEPIVHTLNLPHVGVVGPGIGIMGKLESRVAYGQRIAETNLRLEWLRWTSDEPHAVPSLGGGFMAMRHETLELAGAFDDGMAQWGSEDLELCVRYWLLGYEVWAVPEVTVLHYFRTARPYSVQWHLLTHNLLRVALLHFSPQRLARVASVLRNKVRFGAALAMAADSDVWQKRTDFAARRVRDDDWLFEKFKDSCHV
jgi:glycosyltransferase involved in cell wall biosynthesis